ncbi:MAG: DUF1648 domain-containing protein [Firmicutes bacterium]|jgi:uncharacterized membrane protein|nr:DUF1648 domain-containing protein [Bacillota bacterium]
MKTRVLRESPVLILITLACLAAGVWAYPRLPDRLPTHWNIRGEVDGYSSKAFAVFFFPFMALGMYVLFNVLPSLDPHAARYRQFAGSYSLLRSLIVLFLDGLYLVTIGYGLGFRLDIGLVVRLAISLLIVALGDQMGRVKQNWFVGFKTPWTLSSEENWRRTHRFGAKTMVVGGLLSLLMVPFKPPAFAVASFLAIIAGSLAPVFYSYVLFRRGV